MDCKNKHEDDIHQIFNIMYGQCSPEMQQKLEVDSNFNTIKDDTDSVELLQIIERIYYNYQPHTHPWAHERYSTNWLDASNMKN